jgi:hypothetical protein
MIRWTWEKWLDLLDWLRFRSADAEPEELTSFSRYEWKEWNLVPRGQDDFRQQILGVPPELPRICDGVYFLRGGVVDGAILLAYVDGGYEVETPNGVRWVKQVFSNYDDAFEAILWRQKNSDSQPTKVPHLKLLTQDDE